MSESDFKEYYVYVLMDEQNKEVFFVGRGKDQSSRERFTKEPLNEIKLKRIKEIKKDPNNRLIPITVGRYDTEKEATAVESTLVQWVYGFDNLTNGSMGHSSGEIRDKDDFRVLRGLDVPDE